MGNMPSPPLPDFLPAQVGAEVIHMRLPPPPLPPAWWVLGWSTCPPPLSLPAQVGAEVDRIEAEIQDMNPGIMWVDLETDRGLARYTRHRVDTAHPTSSGSVWDLGRSASSRSSGGSLDSVECNKTSIDAAGAGRGAVCVCERGGGVGVGVSVGGGGMLCVPSVCVCLRVRVCVRL